MARSTSVRGGAVTGRPLCTRRSAESRYRVRWVRTPRGRRSPATTVTSTDSASAAITPPGRRPSDGSTGLRVRTRAVPPSPGRAGPPAPAREDRRRGATGSGDLSPRGARSHGTQPSGQQLCARDHTVCCASARQSADCRCAGPITSLCPELRGTVGATPRIRRTTSHGSEPSWAEGGCPVSPPATTPP